MRIVRFGYQLSATVASAKADQLLTLCNGSSDLRNPACCNWSIREGNDIVIASRYPKGSQACGVSFYRRALSTAASWLCRILFPIRGGCDYTCSYRAYRADVIEALVDRYGSEFISERCFSYMLDILLRLRECNPVASEVPQVLQPFLFFFSKMGRVSLAVYCRTTLIWKRAIKHSKLR